MTRASLNLTPYVFCSPWTSAWKPDLAKVAYQCRRATTLRLSPECEALANL
jgi:hypothetical protein